MSERERTATDRLRFLREYHIAFGALKATPEWAAFQKAHDTLREHEVLYGIVGGLEPVGILHMRR